MQELKKWLLKSKKTSLKKFVILDKNLFSFDEKKINLNQKFINDELKDKKLFKEYALTAFEANSFDSLLSISSLPPLEMESSLLKLHFKQIKKE